MFKLPVCPHCKTVYRYKEVKENNKKKTIECYHCKKEFHNSRAGIAVLAVVVCIIAIIINIIILNCSSGLISSVVPISIVSIIAVIIGMLMIPFFISYKK